MRFFGNPAALRDQITEKWSWTWLENLRQDAGYALRQPRRSPSFVLISVLTLTLGIGANTAIFTLMNSLWLQSLPVKDPNSLILIGIQANNPMPIAQSPMPVMSLPMIESLERHTRSFSRTFGWCDYGAEPFSSLLARDDQRARRWSKPVIVQSFFRCVRKASAFHLPCAVAAARRAV